MTDDALEVKFMNMTHDSENMPKYATLYDACLDLRAHLDNATITIKPGETVKIGTRLKIAVPVGYVMMMFVRSSIGIKKHLCLANGTGIIDSGYRDEVIMALHNFGKEPIEINDLDRVCQFMIIPRPALNLVEETDSDKFNRGNRGGGIGSTGV